MKPDVEVVFMNELIRTPLIIFFSLVFTLAQVNHAMAQGDIPKGTWRSHFSYSKVTLVEKAGNKIFGVTEYGLTYFDLEDKSINKFSKLDGLSDVEVTALAYDPIKNRLALGYQNGNIDLVTSEGIVNYRTLLESEILEDKKVHDLTFKGESLIVSTDFGALLLEIESKLIRESYRNIGLGGQKLVINTCVFFEDKIYIGSQSGVLMSDPTPELNLQDFNNWDHFEDEVIYDKDIQFLSQFNNKIYAATTDALYDYDANKWSEIPLGLAQNELILSVKKGNPNLTILTNQRILMLDQSNLLSSIILTDDINPTDLIQVNQNEFWLGDSEKGLSRWLNNALSRFELNGAYSGNFYKLKLLGKSIIAFPDLDRNFARTTSNGKGLSIFDNGSWLHTTPNDLKGFDNISDIVVQNGDTLLSSFGKGILNQTSGDLFNENNSSLRTYGNTSNILVTAMEKDVQNKVWLTNYSVLPLQSFDIDGNWQQFSFRASESEKPQKLILSNYGQVWMPLGHDSGAGIQAYDPESNAERLINTSNTGNSSESRLPSNQVFDIAFDKDDLILMATELGIAYFPFTYGVVDDPRILPAIPIFEGNFLFKNVTITGIAVDGGNRKWIGTDQGLWLFDSNFDKQVLNFDKDNSPLPSNYIVDLVIHPVSGEVFIATDKGLVSYRSDATEGQTFHENVKIYPNPVRPDYQGLVGIDGLVNNAILKITTVSGRLVREIHAAGGGASWNMADYNGRRVNTGIYLVFSSNMDGSETFVGKIAVVN